MNGRPLKVGVQLPEVERLVPWPELRDMAQTAESVGFDSLWLGDHLLYRRPDGNVGPWEVWTSLAGIAEATTRVEIGPLVASTSFHSPPMLAKMAATVDEISSGRLILGLGAGWNEPDYTAFGFPYDQRVSRFEEAFTIIRTLLRDGHIDFEGKFYSVRDSELRPRGAVDQEDARRRRRVLLPALGLLDAAAGFDPFDREVVVRIGITGSGLPRAWRFAALAVAVPGHLDDTGDVGRERIEGRIVNRSRIRSANCSRVSATSGISLRILMSGMIRLPPPFRPRT